MNSDEDGPKRLMPKWEPPVRYTHCQTCGDWLANDRVKIGQCYSCNVDAVFGNADDHPAT